MPRSTVTKWRQWLSRRAFQWRRKRRRRDISIYRGLHFHPDTIIYNMQFACSARVKVSAYTAQCDDDDVRRRLTIRIAEVLKCVCDTRCNASFVDASASRRAHASLFTLHMHCKCTPYCGMCVHVCVCMYVCVYVAHSLTLTQFPILTQT